LIKVSAKQIVGYLSPAMPALSETFVYEELLALEARGITVVPFSIRMPESSVASQLELANRTSIIYADLGPLSLLRILLLVPTYGRSGYNAVRQLLSDLWECGPLRFGTWKLAYQFLAGAKLAGLLKKHGCTHLHVHFAHTPTQVAMYAAAMAKVPFSVMAHANDIFENGILLRKKCDRSSSFLTISEFNREYLERIGLPKDKLAVVRCGVSFSPRPTVHSVPRNTTVKIGSLGRMVEKKGFDDLLRAVALLKKAGHSVELGLAGDGPMLAELKSLTAELGIVESVQFLGKMDHHEVAAWLQTLDVFVLACKKDKRGDMDGIPVVLMEAMSQSIPVVSTQISGVPELVIHQRTGLLSAPGNYTDLAEKMALVISDGVLREQLAAGALSHVMQEFGQATNIARLLQHVSH
jgi:colanic acid/amylovoran biosynthesis glycosyltransferase